MRPQGSLEDLYCASGHIQAGSEEVPPLCDQGGGGRHDMQLRRVGFPQVEGRRAGAIQAKPDGAVVRGNADQTLKALPGGCGPDPRQYGQEARARRAGGAASTSCSSQR